MVAMAGVLFLFIILLIGLGLIISSIVGLVVCKKFVGEFNCSPTKKSHLSTICCDISIYFCPIFISPFTFPFTIYLCINTF